MSLAVGIARSKLTCLDKFKRNLLLCINHHKQFKDSPNIFFLLHYLFLLFCLANKFNSVEKSTVSFSIDRNGYMHLTVMQSILAINCNRIFNVECRILTCNPRLLLLCLYNLRTFASVVIKVAKISTCLQIFKLLQVYPHRQVTRQSIDTAGDLCTCLLTAFKCFFI